jgi:microcompartment protein CcmK/EutM
VTGRGLWRTVPIAVLLLLAACTPAPPVDPKPNPKPDAARIWFVDNRAEAPTTGDRNSPFATLIEAERASEPGDTIFVFAGDGSNRNLDRGIALQDDQRLIGEGAGLASEGIAAGDAPTLGGTVTLAHDNLVEGLRIEGSAASAIVGGDVGTLELRDLAIVGAGGDGVRIEPSAAGVHRALITGLSVVGSAVSGVHARAHGEATLQLDLRASSLEDNVGSAVQIDYLGAGGGSFVVEDLDIRTLTASGIRAVIDGTDPQEVAGRILGSDIVAIDPAGAGSGVTVLVARSGDALIELRDNHLTGFGSFGIDLAVRGGDGSLDATGAGNRIDGPATNTLAGLRLYSGNGSAGETNALCLALSGNVSTATQAGYLLRQRPGTDYRLEGFSGDGSDVAAVAAFIADDNDGSLIVGSGPIRTDPSFSGGDCRRPDL